MTTKQATAAPTSPPGTELASALRLEVGRLRRRETRRRFDTTVHVGTLGARHESLAVPLSYAGDVDAAIRVDVLCALLEHAEPGPAAVWLTRPGEPEPHDSDLGWVGAAHHAFGLQERRLDGCYVVTRYGWLDPVTGASRRWKRLRV